MNQEDLEQIEKCNPYPIEGNYFSYKNKLYRYNGKTWVETAPYTKYVGMKFTGSVDDILSQINSQEKN